MLSALTRIYLLPLNTILLSFSRKCVLLSTVGFQERAFKSKLSIVFSMNLNPESLWVHWSGLLAVISLLVYYGAGSVYNHLDGYYQVNCANFYRTVEFPHYDSAAVLKPLIRCLVTK